LFLHHILWQVKKTVWEVMVHTPGYEQLDKRKYRTNPGRCAESGYIIQKIQRFARESPVGNW